MTTLAAIVTVVAANMAFRRPRPSSPRPSGECCSIALCIWGELCSNGRYVVTVGHLLTIKLTTGT